MRWRFQLAECHIDIETICELNLKEVGVYAYCAHPTFRIILFSFAWDNEPVVTLDCYYEAYPGQMVYERAPEVWDALHWDGANLKLWAHNAAFEMWCIHTYYGVPIVRANWWCTSVACGYMALPLALDQVAKVLALPEQKAARGKVLIKLFSAPQKKPVKKYDYAVWVTPDMAPNEWLEYCGYNAQDVETERAVHKYVKRYAPMPDIEHEYYEQNEEINAVGVYIHVEFARIAIAICREYLDGIFAQIVALSGIANPNSDDQIKAWILSRGVNIPSLNKDYLKDYVNYALLPEDVTLMLKLRDAKSKTSISKFDKMLEMIHGDDRVRGIHQFYGASTGRFAGRGIQGQNLKLTFSNEDNIAANAKRLGVSYDAVAKLVGNSLETAKQAVLCGLGPLLYDDITEVVSRLVRPAIVAPEGHSLVVVDFASIEARMLAYAAGEDWALEEFRGEGKIYEATAARMYGVTKAEVIAEGKGSAKRKRGKIATLALGYQGGEGALVTSGALRAGMTEDELPGTVKDYRRANPMTCAFWKRVEGAARHVIKNKCAIILRFKYVTLRFRYERNYLFIELPSGRRLAYYGAHLDARGYRLRYWGLKQMKDSNAKAWTVVDLYGGLITENIIQAMARDCLVEAMARMRNKLLIVMHIHDEIVAEATDNEADQTLVYMEHAMSISPLWANDLPLKGDGFISKYYRKD